MEMQPEIPTVTVTAPRPTAAAAAPAPHPSAFHELLSELNPLQYLPVVGTIYRAVTGDTIPEAVRIAGSALVSGLISGPVGIATSLATTAIEHATGIDPEEIAARWLGLKHPAASAAATMPVAAAQVAAAAPGGGAQNMSAGLGAGAFSAAALRQAGVTRGADGTLARGEERGADVLNGLELARLSGGVAAYARAAASA